MNSNIFFNYDLYALERKVPELDFIEKLETSSSLNEQINPFINEVVEALYKSIGNDVDIRVSDIKIPKIESRLSELLRDNETYLMYRESTDKSLSEFVFRKFLKRLFEKDGNNEGTHIVQDYLHAWLEKRLALEITKDPRFSSLEVLKYLIDKTELLFNFYKYLIDFIPKKWILDKKEDWVSVNVSFAKLIDSTTTFGKGNLDYFPKSLQTPPKDNIWNYVDDVTQASDYLMINHEYSFISSVLIRKDLSVWIEFWDNLKLPILQDCVLHPLFDFKPGQLLFLLSTLLEDKTIIKSNVTVLLFIIAKNYFKSSYQITERLSIFEHLDRKNVMNETIFQKGIEVQKGWNEEKKYNYDKIIYSLQQKISNTDLEDWIFDYKLKENGRNYIPNEIFNKEIAILISAYRKTLNKIESLNFKSINLQKFNFYVEIIRESNDEKLALVLFTAIIDFISSDKFFWNKTYLEPYWSAIKGIGFVISLGSNPLQKARELITTFKSNHQGWNPAEIDYSPLVKESFIYSALALLFEHKNSFKDQHEKEDFFKELSGHILMQDRYSQIENSEYHQIPLHLLFLVSNQIFPEIKESYEFELITLYDDLFSLLSILTSDTKPVCDGSKKLIKERLDNEFLLVKKKFNNRGQIDKVQELEKMIEKINLEIIVE